MDDLSGLDWSSQPTRPAQSSSTSQPAFRPSPLPSTSGRSTPISAQQSGSKAPPKAATGDSFANLLAPQATKPVQQLSLQERQKQLLAERSRQSKAQDPYGGDAQFWEGLGSGRSTPAPADRTGPSSQNGDDILSAFNASAPVDRSSHFPPPNRSDSGLGSRSSSTAPRQNGSIPVPSHTIIPAEDDDPFGLGGLPQSTSPAPPPQPVVLDDDDILGELAKPVDKAAAARKQQAMHAQAAKRPASAASDNPRDKALAELVDMGFAPDVAGNALAQTSTGADLQEAVGILLNSAHQESRSKSQGQHPPDRSGSNSRSRDARRAPQRRDSDRNDSTPAWMRADGQNRKDSRSPGADKDVAQYATEIGSSLFKSANSLWKTGQKRVAKAVAEYQHHQEGDPSQPKWMRDAQLQDEVDREPRANGRRDPPRTAQQEADLTQEAMMLDSGRAPPPRPSRQPQRSERPRSPPLSERPRGKSLTGNSSAAAAGPTSTRAPAARSTASPRPTARPTERVTRQAVEEESSQAYVSPARRKKTTPKPPPEAESSLDIFSDLPAPAPKPAASATSTSTPQNASARTVPSSTSTPRPKAKPRQSPSVSASSLATSTSQRQAGTEAFKRGDYATAHTNYTAALAALPSSHPITIVLHSNRALTALKTGDAKSAIVDADAAIQTIGPSTGEGEAIDLGAEGQKPMRDFYGKALMRKAEALEHLEKWVEATAVWRETVEAGVGGAVAIQGRNRCEKASGAASAKPAASRPSKPASRPAARPAPRPAPRSAMADLNGGGEAEAVKRLRAADAAAAAASDEAFALTDSVDARLAAWKAGKSENLRALLASLDTVLWPEADWKKVGMGDLVLAGRVKIVYMKAIAKVHPDKIGQAATTEQRMISAAVFAVLNEAWDAFRAQNGL